MNKVKLIHAIARSIMYGHSTYPVVGNSFASYSVELPRPQTTGTFTQNHSYAKSKAEEIANEIMSNH